MKIESHPFRCLWSLTHQHWGQVLLQSPSLIIIPAKVGFTWWPRSQKHTPCFDSSRSILRLWYIFYEKTAPHTPEQNGVAEIMNCTIVEHGCCMLFEGKISSGFWPYAFECAMYLRNCSPVSHLPDSTPEEAWSETKPVITSFRPFGCPAYAHIPKAKHTKLAWKTRKCIMAGYKVGTKAYQLEDLKTRSIIISWDVIFDEQINPPAVPAPPVDLSEIVWDGELTGDVQGLTQVGDAWDKTDMESPPPAPVTSVRRSSSLDWKKDWNQTEPNCKRLDHRLQLQRLSKNQKNEKKKPV